MAPLEASDAEATRPSSRGGESRRSEMAKRKTRKSNNPNGRPSSGLTERVLLAVTPDLASDMRGLADAMGISTSELWRIAARHWLEAAPPLEAE